MKMAPKGTRKPPEPNGTHADVVAWTKEVMPKMNPLVKYLDKLIRDTVPNLDCAVKWGKAHYGVPKHGWILEMASYNVSVNVVFYAGADFKTPPPEGSGRARYIKLRSIEEAKESNLKAWLKEAAKTPGWT